MSFLASSFDFGAVIIRLKATPQTVAQLLERKQHSSIKAFMGSAVHSTFYESMKDVLGESTTGYLHDLSNDKPFSVSDIFHPYLDQAFRSTVVVGTEIWVRWVGLSSELLGALQTCCTRLPSFRLDHCEWQVMGVDWENRVWGQRWHTAHVIQRRQSRIRFIRLRMITPMLLKSGGVEPYLSPDARLIFGEGLLRRWMMYSHAPEPPQDFQAFLRERVKIVRKHTYIKSEMLRTPQRGLMGQVLYRVEATTPHENECASYLNALAFYAQYAGVGKKTTNGLGMVYAHTR